MLEKSLISLGLSDNEIKIYFKLLEIGGTTAGELAKRVGIARPTLYDILQKMTDQGVISRSLKFGVRTFSAKNPLAVAELFQEKITSIKKDHDIFLNAIPDLMKKFGNRFLAPKVEIFEGLEAVQSVFKDLLLYRDIETYSFWPLKSMVENLTPEYWNWHNKQRIMNNIKIFAIRSQKQDLNMKAAPYMGGGDIFKRYIRLAPKEIEFSMGYWIYENKVAMLSSSKERVGLIIESAEMIEMLKAQWSYIWNNSETLKFDLKDCQPFLDELKKF